MIPLKLSLSGFLSYKKPMELDFSGFDLACISGANGAGKSSLLDAITWALFGRARKGSGEETLINSASDTAWVQFEFEYERDHYRIQRSKTRGRTTLLELQLQDKQGEWIPLTEHALRETEKRIETILRLDYETFINTSFFLQGKADQFAQQPAGKRKEILSSILGLEIWEGFRLEAAERHKAVDMEMVSVEAWLSEVEAELGEENERNARLKAVKQELAQKSALRKDKQALFETFQRQVDGLKERQKTTTLLAEQLQDWQEQWSANENQRLERQNELKQYEQILSEKEEIESAYQKLMDLRRELELCNEQAGKFHTLEQQRLQQSGLISAAQARLEQEIKGLYERKSRVDQLKGVISEWEEKNNTLAEQIRSREEQLARKADQEEKLRDLQQAQADAASENKRLKELMHELEERIIKLKSTESTACPLCGQALTEKHRRDLVADLGRQGKILGDRYRQNQKSQQENDKEIGAVRENLLAFQKVEQERQRWVQEQAKVQADFSQAEEEISHWEKESAPYLAELQTKIEKQDFSRPEREVLAGVEAAARELGYDSESHEKLRQEELGARPGEERFHTLEKARSVLQPLNREILNLEKQSQELQDKIKQQQEILSQEQMRHQQEAESMPDMAMLEMELNGVREEENQLLQELGRAEQLVSVLADQKKRKQGLTARREEMAEQISHLEVLERAFGRNGVPALLIEQALPEIEAKANQILDRLSNGGMSMKFETQRERKAGKKEEGAIQTLDILISDAVGVREYELFSGGEAFRINFAIRLALASALAKRAGARLQTLVIDEGFGSQDEDGRQRLIEAINLVMQPALQSAGDDALSDIRKILVITHLDELKDAFPARIEVEKTIEGSMVRVVA